MSNIYLAFVKLANCWKPFTIIKSYFILDVWLGTNSYNYDFFSHELIMWKVTEPDFWILDLEIFTKRSPNYPKIRHFDIFLKNGCNNFLGFWLEVTKYDLQFAWSLYFRKISNLEIFDLEIVRKLAKMRFLANFLTLQHWQFTGPVNVFFFSLAIFFLVTMFA